MGEVISHLVTVSLPIGLGVAILLITLVRWLTKRK